MLSSCLEVYNMHNNKTREALVNHQQIKHHPTKSEKLADRLQAGPKIFIKNPGITNSITTAANIIPHVETVQIPVVDENQSLQNIIQGFMNQIHTLEQSGLNDQSQKQVSLIGSILNPTTGPGKVQPAVEYAYLNPAIPIPIGYDLGSMGSKQTKVIDLLEQKLYETILGGTDTGNIYRDSTVAGLLKQVASIYGDTSYEVSTGPQPQPGHLMMTGVYYPTTTQYSGLTGAMQQAIQNLTGSKGQALIPLSSDILRNILYQARDLKAKLPASPQPYNPYGQTNKLATIVSSINKQQSVIGLLESRLQSAILGDVNVGDIYRDPSIDILMTIANIYGDKSKVDSRFGFDKLGNPIDGTGISIQGLIDSNGNVDTRAYNKYLAGLTTDRQIANAVRLTPVYTGLTGAMQKGIVDFQQTDMNGSPLPLEQDGLRQLLTQARSLLREQNISYQTEIKQQAPYPVFMGGMVQTIQTMMQQLSSMLNNIMGMGCGLAPKVPMPMPIYIRNPELPLPYPSCIASPVPVDEILLGFPETVEVGKPSAQLLGFPETVQVPSKAQLYSETIRSQIEDLVSQGALDPEHAEFANLQTLMATYSAIKSS